MSSHYRNLATWDRLVRLAVGVVALTLGLLGVLSGLWATAAVIFAWVPLITALLGWCPFYKVLGIRTRRP